MEITIKNTEYLFNILNKYDIYDSIFCLNFTDKEIEIFESSKNADMDKKLYERYLVYWQIKDANHAILKKEVIKSFPKCNVEDIYNFIESVKKDYVYIDHISKKIYELTNSIVRQSVSGNKDAEKQIKKQKSKRKRYTELFKKYDSNFLNRIIDIGMCKAAIKKHLCMDSEDLLLKDAYNRYFKLISIGALDG